MEVLASDWLEQLLRLANYPDVGAVGATLLYPRWHAATPPASFLVSMANGVTRIGAYPARLSWGARRVAPCPNRAGDNRACPDDSPKLVLGAGPGSTKIRTDVQRCRLCCRIRERGLKIAISPQARLCISSRLVEGTRARDPGSPSFHLPIVRTSPAAMVALLSFLLFFQNAAVNRYCEYPRGCYNSHRFGEMSAEFASGSWMLLSARTKDLCSSPSPSSLVF